MFVRRVDVGWLVGVFVGWFIVCLLGFRVDQPIGWLFGLLGFILYVSWLVCCLIFWFVDCFNYLFVYQCVSCLVVHQSQRSFVIVRTFTQSHFEKNKKINKKLKYNHFKVMICEFACARMPARLSALSLSGTAALLRYF